MTKITEKFIQDTLLGIENPYKIAIGQSRLSYIINSIKTHYKTSYSFNAFSLDKNNFVKCVYNGCDMRELFILEICLIRKINVENIKNKVSNITFLK